MFGMSREERRRLDAAEKVAGEGRDQSNRALAELASHAAACNVRQENVERRLGGLEGMARWANRQGLLILLGILGMILLEIAKAKGLF